MEQFRYEWIWDKKLASGHLNAKRAPMKRHENVLVFYRRMPTYNPVMSFGLPYDKGVTKTSSKNYGEQKGVVNTGGSRYPTTIIEESNANRNDRIHPTQKPVALFEYLIKTYTNKGETVLDNCMGSGTTAIACMNTERNFIGFELDGTYYGKSLERIKNHTTQTELFDYL